jgi:Permuted papain-like amidase enzyme, YaeF/YiiX, C92 family
MKLIKNKIKHRKILFIISFLIIIYLILLIPLGVDTSIPESNKKPFIWNQDSVWEKLEEEFLNAQSLGCKRVKFSIDSLFNNSNDILNEISNDSLEPSDIRFRLLENNIFNTAPLIPACKNYFVNYITLYSNLRNIVKKRSRHWNLKSIDSKNTLYRLLYGNRTAIEEIMLQLPIESVPPLIKGDDEPSITPASHIMGVSIHSGDILVSRGGAPTSALIARGNDYPGNFSHVALVYVDEGTNKISIIESHIERGVVISTLDDYLKDTKLRIMVLRLRYDLIKNDPMLPHKAAQYALNLVKSKHIPYDFEMNINDAEKQFCSEVVSSAYNNLGIRLWMGLSNISSVGTRNWLAAFGVRYFVTEGPSDLEYDPQLAVVAEWRDPETLYKDHMDNAVTDVMLEEADSGKVLSYDWYMLPIGRVMKLYSSIINLFGSVGPVPEGMSTEAALRNIKYSDAHSRIAKRLMILANQFKIEYGYVPPYWRLVDLARLARNELKI